MHQRGAAVLRGGRGSQHPVQQLGRAELGGGGRPPGEPRTATAPRSRRSGRRCHSGRHGGRPRIALPRTSGSGSRRSTCGGRLPGRPRIATPISRWCSFRRSEVAVALRSDRGSQLDGAADPCGPPFGVAVVLRGVQGSQRNGRQIGKSLGTQVSVALRATENRNRLSLPPVMSRPRWRSPRGATEDRIGCLRGAGGRHEGGGRSLERPRIATTSPAPGATGRAPVAVAFQGDRGSQRP